MKFFFILGLFICGCTQGIQQKYAVSEKEQIADHVIHQVALTLKKEKGLQVIGTGGGMMHEIHMLALSFEYNQLLDASEGRVLMTSAINTFLSAINTDEKIRPYLLNYPFEPDDIELRIFLTKPDRSQVPLGQLCLISSTQGVFHYKIHDPTTAHLVTAYEETYQEALDKLAVNSTEPQQLLPPPEKPPREEDGRTQISICL